MTIKQYNACLREVENYSDINAFVSDLALSNIWGDEMENIPSERVEWLRSLWLAYHRSVKEIIDEVGLNLTKLSKRFGIPYRTVQDWCAGRRECTLYSRLMLQECLGSFKVEIER